MNYTETYVNQLRQARSSIPDLTALFHKTIIITGATGTMGSCLVDFFMQCNRDCNADIHVIGVGRSRKRLENRFNQTADDHLEYLEQDIMTPFNYSGHADYVIHTAANSYPALIAHQPVETLLGMIKGTDNVLSMAVKAGAKRVLYISSGEVYGNSSDEKQWKAEDDYGNVDHLSARACYPNGKRTAETLCAAYRQEYSLDFVAARPCHTYGPTSMADDNHAHVQFLRAAAEGNDIVLNSPGNQMRTYIYVTDCITALLTVLIGGISGEAYNIANRDSVVTIRQFAEIAADAGNVNFSFTSPDQKALAERSPITRQVLDPSKLESLGWHGSFDAESGIRSTIDILKGN